MEKRLLRLLDSWRISSCAPVMDLLDGVVILALLRKRGGRMAGFKISKRNRSIAMGLICGLLCAICVGVYIAHVDEQASAAQAEVLARYGGDQIDVCVAKRDIAAGNMIGEGDVETKTWIATMLPANAVMSKAEAVGKRVGSTILAGEVISTSRFGFESADIEIPEGFVAISVPSREVQAVGGAIAAGMVTDVYAVGGSSTKRIASAVHVLATSMSSEGASSSSAWVTLAVRPEAVQELVTAAETLEMYFALPSESVLREEGDAGADLKEDEPAGGGHADGDGAASSDRAAGSSSETNSASASASSGIDGSASRPSMQGEGDIEGRE